MVNIPTRISTIPASDVAPSSRLRPSTIFRASMSSAIAPLPTTSNMKPSLPPALLVCRVVLLALLRDFALLGAERVDDGAFDLGRGARVGHLVASVVDDVERVDHLRAERLDACLSNV